jgi:hypothetical protein
MKTKACTCCNEEKPDNTEYFYPSNGTNPDGSKKTRGKCKKCQDKERWAKQKQNSKPIKEVTLVKEDKPTPIQEVKKVHTPKCNSCFTELEVESLKRLIKGNAITGYNVIAEIEKLDKSERIKSIYNVDIKLRERLNEYCKARRLSQSDIVNLAIMRFLDTCYNGL